MGLTCPQPHAAGFLADADRFHSDVSGEEFLHRQEQREKKSQMYDALRRTRAEREEERWKRIEDNNAKEKEYWEEQRKLGLKAKKNSSGVPYNTISLKYDEGSEGDQLRHEDDMVRYRAALRSQNLLVCGDTRVSYDIINGTGRPT